MLGWVTETRLRSIHVALRYNKANPRLKVHGKRLVHSMVNSVTLLQVWIANHVTILILTFVEGESGFSNRWSHGHCSARQGT